MKLQTIALVMLLSVAAFAQVPSLVQVHDCSEMWGDYPVQGSAIAIYRSSTAECRLPVGAKAGNTIVVGFTDDNANSGQTVGDDKSDSYTCASFADTTNGEKIFLCYATNVTADAQHITINLGSSGTPYVNPWVAEFTNVANVAADCTHGHNASGTSVTAGSCTPSASGDLVVQSFWNDYGVQVTGITAGSQSNITWSLLVADRATGVGAQWGVYNSTSALNATMSITAATAGSVSEAIFLKAGSSGSVPSGIRVVAAKDMWMNNSGASSAPFTSGTRTEQFPCPSTANLMYLAWIGGPVASLTSVTDSHSQTWTATGAGVLNDSYSRSFYQAAATVSTDQTVTVTASLGSGAGADGTPKLYCVIGAATAPFDQTQTATGNQTVAGSTLTTVSITPSAASGVIFVSAGNAFNTLSGLTGTGQWFHSGFSTGEIASNLALNGVDQNNGWGMIIPPDTSSITFTWNNYLTSTADGQWVARADSFLAPAATGKCAACDLSRLSLPTMKHVGMR